MRKYEWNEKQLHYVQIKPKINKSIRGTLLPQLTVGEKLLYSVRIWKNIGGPYSEFVTIARVDSLEEGKRIVEILVAMGEDTGADGSRID